MMVIRLAHSLQTWSGLATPKVTHIKKVHVRCHPRRRFSTRRSNIVMMPEGPEVRTLVDQLQPAVGMRLKDFKFLSGRYVTNDRPRGFKGKN